MKYKISVFTPTYNRGDLISRVYSSLVEQTFKDFEWIIIDDGSTDQTENLISKLKNENKVDIVYHKVQNGGKHRAINKGVSLANGELFFIVDSDDYIVNNALELIVENWDKIPGKEEFCGVAGLRGYDDDTVIGNHHRDYIFDCSILEYRYKYKIKGDKAEVFVTDILKKNKFPEISNEKFISESIVWNKLGSEYKMRWLNEIIYICNYLENGLSDKSFQLRKNNLEGTLLLYKTNLTYNIPITEKLKSIANYYRFIYHNRENPLKKWIGKSPIYLNTLGIILGLTIYIIDHFQIKKSKNLNS